MLAVLRDFFFQFHLLTEDFTRAEFKFAIFLMCFAVVFFQEVIVNTIREVFFGKKPSKNIVFK